MGYDNLMLLGSMHEKVTQIYEMRQVHCGSMVISSQNAATRGGSSGDT